MAQNAGTGSAGGIEVGDHRFRIDGTAASMYGGAVHYWRLERNRWDQILETVTRMGFTSVTTYIPWEVHELAPGRFDFGEVDPRKDVDAFITLAGEKGLHVVARPGPQINSELTSFGYPKRLLTDERLHARNAMGAKAVLTQAPRPIPVLSYATDRFYEETAGWYDAICPILANHAHPEGPLVAAQVDNEMAFFFAINAYAADFHPDAIGAYQEFLERRYRTVEALNDTYGRAHESFAQIDPPRRFEGRSRQDIPYYADWAAYRERYLIDSMARLAGMMRDRGLAGIPLFHNYPHPLGPGGAASGFTTPLHLAALEAELDFVGFDFYSRKELYDHVKTIVSYVVGTSRFPYIPEFIAGVWPWYLLPGGTDDEEFVTKAALMHGIKGFSRYMLVERDRWLDSPIRRDGRVREDHAVMFRRANEVATELGLNDLRRGADVLLLANRDYDRLESASVLVSFPGDFLETPSGFSEYPSFMTVSEDPLGFAEPIQMVKTDWFGRCYRGLTAAGFSFLISDTELSPDRWTGYEVLVVPSFEYLDRALQVDLVGFARNGGTVVIGPEVPELDERIKPCDVVAQALRAGAQETLSVAGRTVGTQARLGDGRLVHLSEATAGSLAEALGGTGLTRFRRNDDRVDVAIHHDPDDSSRLVAFVVNPTNGTIAAEVEFDLELKAIREIWDDRDVAPKDSVLTDELPPYTIRIYECTV